MMMNKVLVKLFVPELDSKYDIFVPVNEIIWKVEKLIIKAVSDLSIGNLDTKQKYTLVNKNTGKQYAKNDVVINTDIRNATELILVSVKK